ncbi:MAG: formate dehydrogenase subunit delta [Phyllobacterium sp.]
MPPDKLVYMANQIGRFFATQSKTQGPEAVANHLTMFWDPRMREEICAYLHDGGVGFDPIARQAVELLSRGTAAKTA